MFGRRKREDEKARLEAEHAHEELMKELSKPICQRKGGKHLYRDFPPSATGFSSFPAGFFLYKNCGS